MQNGQLLAAIGISFGLAAGAVGGWVAVQRWQQQTAQTTPSSAIASSSPVRPALYSQSGERPAAVTLSQAENDYLFDLARSLQSVEQRRINDAERLAIGRQIADWLESGADYWGIRSRFDQRYRSVLAGDYGQNRDAYIKFATERLAPSFVATLAMPPEIITRTEYVETPGPTQIITVPSKPKVITVREPVPVPVIPQPLPEPCTDYPDCDPAGHPPTPDYPHFPDHPSHPDSPHAGKPEYPDYPEVGRPDFTPPPVAEEPATPPVQPDDSAVPNQQWVNHPAPSSPKESAIPNLPIQEVIHTEVQ